MYTYIYIYTYREREREIERYDIHCTRVYVCMIVYIHIYIYIYVYIYIYIYTFVYVCILRYTTSISSTASGQGPAKLPDLLAQCQEGTGSVRFVSVPDFSTFHRFGSVRFGSENFVSRSDAVRPAFFGRVVARSASVRFVSASGSGRFRN